MSYASRELLRAFNAAAIEEVGRKKTLKILHSALAALESQPAPANDAGPEIGAKADAAQVIRSAMRLCMLDRQKRKLA